MSQLTGNQLRRKFIDFYKARGHAEIPPAPLIPENDPTTLFTNAGMQPLVPYILGQPHPLGKRLTDSQPVLRLQGFNDDIMEVGDNRHLTFYEMLGNWSLGDYFKKEQLRWIFEFLTQELNIDPHHLYFSVFAGYPKSHVPADETSVNILKQLFSEVKISAPVMDSKQAAKAGMKDAKIFYYDVKKNWWSRTGPPDNMPEGEPGGPTSEVFYEFTQIKHNPKFGKHCHPNCDCGRFLEIGNSVFMEYKKMPDGSLEKLKQHNVDFGGGFERIFAVIQGTDDAYQTPVYKPMIDEIVKASTLSYSTTTQKPMRIIADHLKASTFMIGQGLEPSNKLQGYILRRLIRRAVINMRQLNIKNYSELSKNLVKQVKNIYSDTYAEVNDDQRIAQTITLEVEKFNKTINRGFKELEKHSQITPQVAFDLFQSYGFPFEITQEIASEKGQTIDEQAFKEEFAKHQQKSRTAAAGMFKGGLADHSETATQYHTATHLLHAALRKVLGDHVQQKGSNITGERLRFDFSHPQKLTEAEIKQVEDLVNQQIKTDLPVSFQTMSYNQALKSGALAFFGEKYPEKVKVYTIGDPQGIYFSREICGGPHVEHTGQIGKIEIFKETSAGSNLRRIYARMV